MMVFRRRRRVYVVSCMDFCFGSQIFSFHCGPVGCDHPIASEEDAKSDKALQERNIAEAPLFQRRETPIRTLMIPLRAAGILFDKGNVVGDLRNHLHCTASVAYDGHPLASIVIAVIPAGGMEDFTLEGFHSWEFGVSGFGNTSHG